MYLKATAELALFEEECAKGPDAAVAKAFPKLAPPDSARNPKRSSWRTVVVRCKRFKILNYTEAQECILCMAGIRNAFKQDSASSCSGSG